MKRAASIVLAMLLSACSEPLEFADWTIPVPEGTRVVEYRHVPPEQRSEWIELEKDWTIGSDEDTSDGSFYRPFAIASDEEGRVYVADAGEHQVKIFDLAGNYVRSIGSEGQGPGEFRGPTLVAVAGSAIVVGDETKLSLWTVEGEHIDDVATRALGMSYLGGVNDGSVVVGYQTVDTATREVTSNFVGWNQSAQETAFYAALREPEFRYYPDASSERRTSVGTGMTWPAGASTRDGEVYVTHSDEYQVLALDAEGKPRWALRVAMSRPPLYPLEIERTLESVRRRFPEATESAIDWPGTSYALSRIWLDGHGHLYVFPYAPPQLEAQERQVDVYSRDGTRLFAGRMSLPAGAWTNLWAAYDDFVYYLGPDEETSEWGVARYRLVEPFE